LDLLARSAIWGWVLDMVVVPESNVTGRSASDRGTGCKVLVGMGIEIGMSVTELGQQRYQRLK